MEVSFAYTKDADLKVDPPSKQTLGSAGFDIRANLLQADRELGVSLSVGEIVAIPTGIMLAMPDYVVCDLRSRSGLAQNFGIVVLNSPGTIDSDFRGEITVLLINHGREGQTINHGDRVAQLVFLQALAPELIQVTELDRTVRGKDGFGSTGDD